MYIPNTVDIFYVTVWIGQNERENRCPFSSLNAALDYVHSYIVRPKVHNVPIKSDVEIGADGRIATLEIKSIQALESIYGPLSADVKHWHQQHVEWLDSAIDTVTIESRNRAQSEINAARAEGNPRVNLQGKA